MESLETRHLRYFVAVAEELNFVRAAQRLHISQPPLTRQIQQLEAIVGVKLLHRDTRNVTLTCAGTVFLPEARAALAQMAQGVAIARATAGQSHECLSIGFEVSAVGSFVTRAVRIMRTRFPGTDVKLLTIDTGDQVDAMRAGTIDIGFIVPSTELADIEAETVSEVPLVVALPAFHPLADRAGVRLAELAEEDFVLTPQSHRCGLHEHVLRACGRAGFYPRGVQEAGEMQLMLALIGEGVGISLLPSYVRHFGRQDLAFVAVEEPAEHVRIAMAWRRKARSPIALEFAAIVRECAAAEKASQASASYGNDGHPSKRAQHLRRTRDGAANHGLKLMAPSA